MTYLTKVFIKNNIEDILAIYEKLYVKITCNIKDAINAVIEGNITTLEDSHFQFDEAKPSDLPALLNSKQLQQLAVICANSNFFEVAAQQFQKETAIMEQVKMFTKKTQLEDQQIMKQYFIIQKLLQVDNKSQNQIFFPQIISETILILKANIIDYDDVHFFIQFITPRLSREINQVQFLQSIRGENEAIQKQLIKNIYTLLKLLVQDDLLSIQPFNNYIDCICQLSNILELTFLDQLDAVKLRIFNFIYKINDFSIEIKDYIPDVESIGVIKLMQQILAKFQIFIHTNSFEILNQQINVLISHLNQFQNAYFFNFRIFEQLDENEYVLIFKKYAYDEQKRKQLKKKQYIKLLSVLLFGNSEIEELKQLKQDYQQFILHLGKINPKNVQNNQQFLIDKLQQIIIREDADLFQTYLSIFQVYLQLQFQGIQVESIIEVINIFLK